MDASAEKLAGSNLTPIAEYTETAAALADLRQRHAGVVYDVTVPKEMKLAKEARAELRGLRTGLEKKRVEIKAPALERCRLIDAEAKRITGELVALEEPIDIQIKTEETRAEAEKLAKFEAERLRVEAIQKRIDEIRNLPATLVGKPSVIIAGQLAKLKADELSEDEFAEHFVIAREAHTTAIVRVEQLLAAQQEADAEKKRQAERDAEMEAMRLEKAEMQAKLDQAEAERVERERQAAAEEAGRVARVAAEKRQREIDEQRRVQAIRDRITSIAEMAIAIAGRPSQWLRDTLGDLDGMRPSRDADSFDQFLGEASLAWDEAHDKIEAEIEVALLREKAEADAQAQREAEDARLQVERERQADEQRKLDEQAAQLKREREAAAKKAEADRLANLGLREAAQAVVDFFAACNWNGEGCKLIDDLRAVLANDAAQVKPARAKRAARA